MSYGVKMTRIVSYLQRNGVKYTLRRGAEAVDDLVLHTYDRRFRWYRRASRKIRLYQRERFIYGLGRLSVVIPVYNTRPEHLRALAYSLILQTYDNWEAIFYDGGSTDEDTLERLDELPEEDSRIRVIHGESNLGISGNTNAAIAQARGKYIVFCDHDDTLAVDALWWIAKTIDDAPWRADLVYSDEDRISEDGRIHFAPHDKPDFCPDNLRSGNYICHVTAVRRDLLDELGGLRPAFDGSQDHDLALRISEVSDRICHIPRTLYHWRSVGASMSRQHLDVCQDAAARAVEEHMARIGYPGSCRVENGALRLRYEVQKDYTIQTIRTRARMNWADLNRTVKKSTADVLLFLDESIPEFTPEELQEMLMYIQRDDVGAVTPMLTDKRGRITHAGFCLSGRWCAVSRNEDLPGHAGGWHNLNHTVQNVAAVSAACMMVRRDHFIPFDEEYDCGLCAVDWCLHLGEKGLRHVYTPHVQRVCVNRRLLSYWLDMDQFRAKWPLVHDPCYSVHHDVNGQFTYRAYHDDWKREALGKKPRKRIFTRWL